MILKEIQLCHFCQFHHAQRIQFTSDSVHQNITLISGPDSSNKASIIDAIFYCLYGEQFLSQKGGVPHKTIDTYVQLEFEHQEKLYTIKRIIRGKAEGQQIVDAESDTTLTIIEGSRIISKHRNPQEVLELVKSILGGETLDLFIFSSEMAEALRSMMDGQKQGVSQRLSALLDSLGQDMRHYLSSELNTLLPRLIPKHDRLGFKEAEITDTCLIILYDHEGISFQSFLPMCDSYVVAIAFMLALLKVLSTKLSHPIPFIMDSPFERLDVSHRRSLIEVMLQEQIQWILFTSDAELQTEEVQMLSGRSAHVYTLEIKDFNTTTIIRTAPYNI
jgi:DNA repair exonuclease SbcCD ATPase subunit